MTIGWYSTGVFYWAKTFTEIFPIIITIICYSYVVDIYESENSMFVEYTVILTLGSLQIQGLGHMLGVLTGENTRIGVFIILGYIVLSFLFTNIMIPVKELHYTLREFSNFITSKLAFESIMVLYYGLDRCSDREFSYILVMLDIEDRDLYIDVYLLVIQFFIFRALALIFLFLKVNPIVNSKKNQGNREKIAKEFGKYDTGTKILV